MSPGVMDRNQFISSAQVENVFKDLLMKQLRAAGQEGGSESFVGLGTKDKHFLNIS